MRTTAKLELLHEMECRRHNWVLLEDYYKTHNGIEWIIPKGFKTDLASIPGILAAIVSPQEIAYGALLHDYFYQYTPIPRKEADLALYNIIREEHEVGPIRAALVYFAVRIGGHRYYGK